MTSRAILLDAGRVLVGWALLLALEHFVVGVACREEFAGAWELWPARIAAAPLFLGIGLFGAAAMAVVARLLDAAQTQRAALRSAQAIGGAFGAAIGWGVSGGRHFATEPARVGLAFVVAAGAMVVVYMFSELRRRTGRAAALVELAVAVLAWWIDGHVLVRLYPAFHLGLFALSLASAALAALDAKVFGPQLARVALVLGALAALFSPAEARKLRGYDNLRRVLVERAPWMGRAVLVGTWLSPPDAVAVTSMTGPGEVARALDWTSRDVVLISIDALRADHVGAYGYERKTTPHIDALAKDGTLFRWAYCPTPHTSYSVTSMMTGKYMRPLLALGLGEDSETLAGHLRRYGYRTAGFYPPAVFFIDEARFGSFEQTGLDFEYRKVEFADPALREEQVSDYLASASDGQKPLFLWVHFFEPHEPYVQHPEHAFGPTDLDAYDSEVATADDGVGRIVALVRKTKPSAAIIVTADHGEEFGDHGGRYHGTTVYEEQVRVPMIVSGPGVRAGVTVDAPVQTIDLVPTLLSAEGIPRPARVRGRDLGPLLVKAAPSDPGFAFAETDDYSLLAKGPLRLVCDKQSDGCALFDAVLDPIEKHDVAASHHDQVASMRSELEAIERSHGRYEGQGADLPDALRRGSEGDVSAALEVAGLLEDANVGYRRRAAEILFDLRSPKAIPALRRAAEHDEDVAVRDTAAVALARIDTSEPLERTKQLCVPPDAGESSRTPERSEGSVANENKTIARFAALALAERADPSGASILVEWLGDRSLEFARAREIVAALATCKARSSVPVLVGLLDDVRLRAHVADALGALGDASATAPLLAHFAQERYVVVRPHEAKALLALGAKDVLLAPLARFAGLPEPMAGAVGFAAAAGLLTPAHGGARPGAPQAELTTTLESPSSGPARLGVLLEKADDSLSLDVNGAELKPTPTGNGEERWASLPEPHERTLRVTARAEGGISAVWVVGASSELPPPPPSSSP